MKIICVDDEKLLMEETVSICRELPGVTCVRGFTRSEEALAYAGENPVDLAILDIDIPGMNGLELAAAIKAKQPDAAVIFLTGYSEFAVDAFYVRATGYLLKPVSREKLQEEAVYALSLRNRDRVELGGHVAVQTFQSFDVFVDGNLVGFSRAKCKELLAYLIDKQGSSVTRAEIASILWEDRLYDRKMQKQLDVYIRALRDTLREYGIEEILEMQKGSLRIRPELLDCDVYRFFAGDSDAVNAYRGEYMGAYSWASMTESLMYWKMVGKP